MTVLHIVAGLPPGGGISESVPALCRHLRLMGHDVTLATLDGEMSAAALLAGKEGVRLVRFAPSWPGFLYFSRAMLRGLQPLVAKADVVHVHSNWTFPVWWGCRLALKARRSLVMSPRGCLDPVRLRHSAWKKRLAGILDRHYLRRANVVHATSRAEAEGVEKYLGAGRRIVVIPNGVEVDAFAGAKRREDLVQRWPECGGKKVALFLSRLHPLKGLDLLVGAWKDVAGEFGDWHLLIAGPDENGYEAEVRRMVQRAGLAPRMTFCGPLYGTEKAAVMRAVDLFVLPTRHENFGIVVAEALASGVPVITTRGAPWGELRGWGQGAGVRNAECGMRNGERGQGTGEEVRSQRSEVSSQGAEVRGQRAGVRNAECGMRNGESEQGTGDRFGVRGSGFRVQGLPAGRGFAANGRCGWWVEVGVEPLAGALREAMALSDEERREMGWNGRRLVEEKYTWKKAAAMMMAVYEEAQGAVHV